MRIEINTGGVGSLSLLQHQMDMTQFLSDADSVINCFKTVKNNVCDLPGGVGNLEDAVNNLNARIAQEEARKAEAVEIKNKTESFIDLAQRVDQQVGSLVNRNKEEFYRINPWLRPPVSASEEKGLLEQVWDWLCGTGETIAEGVTAAWKWTKDTLGKAWDAAVAFYTEHKKIIDTVLIVVGAIGAIVAVVATGGVALAPLLAALGCSAAVATTISTVVAVTAVVSTVGSSILNLIDTWCDVDNPMFNFFQSAFTITSTVTNLAYSIGSIYNSVKGINPREFVAQQKASQPITNANQLSSSQADAIQRYTGPDEYKNINNSLRGLEQATPENSEAISQMKSALDRASLPQDMTLYRGTSTDSLGALKNLSPEELVGKTFTESGFMSTSADYSIARYHFTGNMKMTIHAPQGSQAINISSLSELPHEAEYLFNAGTQMLITSAQKTGDTLFLEVLIP